MKKNILEMGLGKLGFGLMRLPENNGVIDIAQVKKMADIFIDRGYTYFDSAYGYHGGRSEEAVKTAIVDRFPRDRVRIATKLPLWGDSVDYKAVFSEQLKRTGAGYFDFYLLHGFSLEREKFAGIEDIFEYLLKKKDEGVIRHFGFSTHDKADALDKVLTNHPEFEFVQFQLNYADWDSEGVQSAKCYDVAIKHNVPIIVMEPVRGGTLSTLPAEAASLFRAINPDDTLASWAIRYCMGFEGIATILSGMSDIGQMNDNIKTVSEAKPLNAAERDAIKKAVGIIRGIDQIPCTDCRYCIDECPQKINIPGFIHIANEFKIYGNMTTAKRAVGFVRHGGGSPADCTACGSCERKCPQNVRIIDAFKQFRETILA